MLVVIDTNVIVSGLLNGAGKPGRILDMVLDSRIQVAFDDRILAEYEDVLARPEFNFNQSDVRAVINHIELSGCYSSVETAVENGLPDPDDLPFIQVLICSDAEALITGNIRHFPRLLINEKPVLSPTQFLTKYFP